MDINAAYREVGSYRAAAKLRHAVARQSEGTTRPPVARDQARPSTSARR